ncbi:MAG TPA: type I-C CRISPR-associated protein Cas8c/Csd1, partial [Candidatus Dorea intestinavium]|nr:type I-C CRISPR-associated protein Cas8c/Csd1 [Candidatus Dorea intestinavium]
VIPCTIDSSTRANAPSPHALHDKLQYVAGDYATFGGKVKKGQNPYQDYLNNLAEWCESEYTDSRLKAVYNYIKKGHLIEDLVRKNILFAVNNQLVSKWNKELENKYGAKPEIFKSVSVDQFSAFVRFNVSDPQNPIKHIWEDKKLYNLYIKFYSSKLGKDKLCYVTGKVLPSTDKHASRLRYGGDMAKLISGNDNTGFTFRGRFSDKNDVATVSYEVSQKAHNALKWLITKQGKTIDGRVFLTWGSRNGDKSVGDLPLPEDDLYDLLDLAKKEIEDDPTHSYFARELSKALDGYKNNLDYHSQVYIMVLDAATPGRMSIVYYRTMDKELYLDRIKEWHTTCSWRHSYRKNKDGERIIFYGAPSTRDIVGTAYGSNAGDKLIKSAVARLLPCVVDRKKIPLDFVNSILYRTANPLAMERWEWEKQLSIACAVMKKHYEKEEFTMALDKGIKDRNYLFGRMLAVADVLENRALMQERIDRPTNALRYMSAFAKHPLTTWDIIQKNLVPYQTKLGIKGIYYKSIIDEINDKFIFDEYSDQPLNGKYLLGYYQQRYDLYQKKEKDNDNDEKKE